MPDMTDLTNATNLATECNNFIRQVNLQAFVSPADAAILQELTAAEAKEGIENFNAYIGLLQVLIAEANLQKDLMEKSVKSMSLI